MTENIRVGMRLRPLTALELSRGETTSWEIDQGTKSICQMGGRHKFQFNYNFGESATNKLIFDQIVKDIVSSAVQGINGTCFAYGQTSSGKTHTISGSQSEPGILSLGVSQIFRQIDECLDREFLLRISYLEVYNECVRDLLASPDSDELMIHEDREKGFFVKDLTETIVTSQSEVFEYLSQGERQRHFGPTNMNERSSRSHVIFRLIIESKTNEAYRFNSTESKDEAEKILVSTLNFVDLAGSERLSQTGTVGERQKEGKMINKSLLFLGIVISKLSEGEKHIPFRDSKLTRILQSSLGGNSRTAIIVCCSPALSNIEYTISSLRFGTRAVKIKNQARINEVEGDQALIHRHHSQIEQLRSRLSRLYSASDEKDEETLEEKLAAQDHVRSQLEARLQQLQKLILVSRAAKASHETLSEKVVLARAHSMSDLQSSACRDCADSRWKPKDCMITLPKFRPHLTQEQHNFFRQEQNRARCMNAEDSNVILSARLARVENELAELTMAHESKTYALDTCEKENSRLKERMVDYEEKTELLEMLTSGAGLEKLEEVGLEHLEKKLEASLKLVSKFKHWAEFKRLPLICDSKCEDLGNLPVSEQLQIVKVQKDLLSAEIVRANRRFDEIDQANLRLSALLQKQDEEKIEELANLLELFEEEKEKRMQLEACLEETQASLNYVKQTADEQMGEIKSLKQTSRETSLKLLKHFQQHPFDGNGSFVASASGNDDADLSASFLSPTKPASSKPSLWTDPALSSTPTELPFRELKPMGRALSLSKTLPSSPPRLPKSSLAHSSASKNSNSKVSFNTASFSKTTPIRGDENAAESNTNSLECLFQAVMNK